MAIFMVAYELETDEARSMEEQIVTAIKSVSDKWWHHLLGIWLVPWNGNAEELYERLKPAFSDKSDSGTPVADIGILVIKVAKPYKGWLPKSAWEWLDKADFD